VIDVFILAIALSMDALAVSIGLGVKHNSRTVSLGFMCASHFCETIIIFRTILTQIYCLRGWLSNRELYDRIEIRPVST